MALNLTIAIFAGSWVSSEGLKFDPIIVYRYGALLEAILAFGTQMVLTNSMIPISLIISLEMVKLLQAYFINNDNEMYNAESDRNSKVFMSSLNEELGQIEFIFSDKTGTLTCDKMEFKMCIVGNVLYGDTSPIDIDPKTGQSSKPKMQIPAGLSFYDERLKNVQKGVEDDKDVNLVLNDKDTGKEVYRYKKQQNLVDEYFLLLALCHDCVLETDDHGTRYEGESPDEIALVKTAQQMGFMFTGASSGFKNIKVHG